LDFIQASHLKADLTFLSSDALEGRRSMQRGDEVAIGWIASEFAKAGLKPAAGDSYLQPVPLIEYQPERAMTSLILHHGGESETYHASDATCNCPNEVTVAAPVIFAGFGITAPELNYDDYAGIDAKGKIVLILRAEPQQNDANSIFNGTGNTRYASNDYKLMNAARHGAVGVMTPSFVVPTNTSGVVVHRLPSRLPPGHRHGGKNQFREDDENSEAGVSLWVRDGGCGAATAARAARNGPRCEMIGPRWLLFLAVATSLYAKC
jgi:hypothetical protein